MPDEGDHYFRVFHALRNCSQLDQSSRHFINSADYNWTFNVLSRITVAFKAEDPVVSEHSEALCGMSRFES